MAYCQNCGTDIGSDSNYCHNCGIAAGKNTYTSTSNKQMSDTAKTVGTVAGVAVGASLLSRLFHRRRRPPIGPHPGGMMGGPGMHGPGGPRGHR